MENSVYLCLIQRLKSMESANNLEDKDKGQRMTQGYEETFHTDLHQYLKGLNLVDAHFPDAPDLEALWPKIGESYMPDGVREFNSYPTVALGWIMYIGMAVAKYWDEDWELYSKVENLYKYLRDRIDFDHLDDYVAEKVLLLDGNGVEKLRRVISECASRLNNRLMHLGVQPGSEEAFRAFIAALHEMYRMGVAVELKTLGYHMVKMS